MTASAQLVVGVRADQIVIRDKVVVDVQKYDEDTGRPYIKRDVRPVWRLFGVEIPAPVESSPADWPQLKGLLCCTTGENAWGEEGLHLDQAVIGLPIVDTGDLTASGEVLTIPVTWSGIVDACDRALREAAKKLGGQAPPVKLFLVGYSSF